MVNAFSMIYHAYSSKSKSYAKIAHSFPKSKSNPVLLVYCLSFFLFAATKYI